MLRFFEPELVSSASNRLRFDVRNDAVLPLLSSSLLANNFAASNVSPGTERLNTSFQLNTLFSSTAPSINPVPGQATSMASGHAMDLSKYNANKTDARKQRRHTTDQPTSARESKRQKPSPCNANKQHNAASSVDESSQQQLMRAQGAAKKSQKLGDKITALQQMVSPFGKTDTASVLQEAGVCIKVLHEQIRVLSTPYFGLEPPPTVLGGNAGGIAVGLRERGLCVVPITSTIENLSNREPIDSFVLERLGWGAGIRHH